MNFTIQLVAASSEAAVQDYIEHHHLTDTAAYFHTLQHGSPWYSVVYGSFTSDQQARAALKQLPPALTQASPWLRQFDEIQNRPGAHFTEKSYSTEVIRRS